MLEGLTGDPEHGQDVDVEGVVQLLVGEILQAVLGDLTASVVDQNIQSAEGIDCVGDQLAAEPGICEITREQGDLLTVLLHNIPDPLGVLLLIGEVVQGNVRALAGEGDGHRGTDTGVTTGDQGATALKTSRATVGELTAVGLGDKVRIQARFGLILDGWFDLRVAGDRVLEGQLVGGFMIGVVGGGTVCLGHDLSFTIGGSAS